MTTEPTNLQRADRVAGYVQDYFAKYEGDGEDISTTVQDIVSDLLHYAITADSSFMQSLVEEIEVTARPLRVAHSRYAAMDWSGGLLQSARDRFLEEFEEEQVVA